MVNRGGRPPKPTNVVPFKGDGDPAEDEAARKRRSELAIRRATELRPKWLSPAARKIWDNEAPTLTDVAVNRLHRHHADQFGLYCMAFAELLYLEKDIAKNGHSYKTGAGRNGDQERGRPAVAQRNKAFEKCVQLGAYFGKTPYTERHINTLPQGDLFDDADNADNKDFG
ncbi:MAG: P27 family phage terminase small subunit [Pseudomonadota bacterium]